MANLAHKHTEHIYSLASASRKLRISHSHLCEICVRANIGRLTEGDGRRILSESDLDRVSALRKPVGNPNFLKT